jgi:hypothetical protein
MKEIFEQIEGLQNLLIVYLILTQTYEFMMKTSGRYQSTHAITYIYPYVHTYVARAQSKFPTRPTASKPYIARSDCAYVIEQCCSMAHALMVLPAFSQ